MTLSAARRPGGVRGHFSGQLMPFADLGLSDELLRAVTEAGYTEPTPIQAQAIPPVLMMKDLIGIAQTGTGKTASFVLPMIDILAHGRNRARMPRSLILEPTRELAAQVAENFEKYGKYHKLSMALLIGGVQMGDQVAAPPDSTMSAAVQWKCPIRRARHGLSWH
jgi:superfamily II DNA/RNA helicase